MLKVKLSNIQKMFLCNQLTTQLENYSKMCLSIWTCWETFSYENHHQPILYNLVLFFFPFFSNNHFGRWIPIWNKFHLNLWLAIFKLKFHQMIFFWFIIHVQVNIPANSYFTWIISIFKLDIFYSELVNSEVTHRFCENSFLNYQLIFIEKKKNFHWNSYFLNLFMSSLQISVLWLIALINVTDDQ